MGLVSTSRHWSISFGLVAAMLITRVSVEQSAAAQDAPTAVAHAAATNNNDADWKSDLAHWRAAREAEIDAPDGWLTLVALEWLKPGVNAVGVSEDNQIRLHMDAPDHLGVFEVSGHGVELEPPASGFPADLEVDGRPAQAGPLVVTGAKPTAVHWHGLTIVALSRGDRFALRVKDANSSTRTSFHGLNWFAPDGHFRVEAKWIPYIPPHIEKIPTVIGTTLNLPAPGVAEFTLYGKTMRLEPVLEDPEGKDLFFILRDQTRYDTTYEAARFLHTGLPSNGLSNPGTLTLDFNRLENPPCAYTPYATCPLPPEGNRLLVKLSAGEKRYSH